MTEQELLKEKLHYDPDTGIFTALHSHGTRVKGESVGSLSPRGYLVAHFNGKLRLCHRLAFLYMLGEWPELDVDHKDTVKTNNKWINLRVVTKSVNSRNKSIHKNNTSGTVGVSWNTRRSRWVATIYVDGRLLHLGYFQFKEDAVLARMTAEKDYGYWLDKLWDQL